MKDCKESTQGMEEGIETKGKYESNQNIIWGVGTGWKMKDTWQKYGRQDNKEAHLYRHTDKHWKRTFRSFLVDISVKYYSNMILIAKVQHFSKLL
jgi:hypothetical protein